jgi:phospholipase/carboxylesterase
MGPLQLGGRTTDSDYGAHDGPQHASTRYRMLCARLRQSRKLPIWNLAGRDRSHRFRRETVSIRGMAHSRVSHAEQPVLTAGVPLDRARVAVIMLHGRGATAGGMLTLADELKIADATYLAPQAGGNTWYPFSFLTPIERNEPWLSSALDRVATILAQCAGAGIPAERVVLLGFSQGACLAVEFAARQARRYGGLAVLSGGLIGPTVKPETYSGNFDAMPAFLGCSDVDPHIPLQRVRETVAVLERMGAEVTMHIYPGMGHTINEDELEHVRAILAGVSHG